MNSVSLQWRCSEDRNPWNIYDIFQRVSGAKQNFVLIIRLILLQNEKDSKLKNYYLLVWLMTFDFKHPYILDFNKPAKNIWIEQCNIIKNFS